MRPNVACVTSTRNDLGESPCWDAGAGVLYWIDAWKATLHAYDPLSRDIRLTEFATALCGRPIGSIARRAGRASFRIRARREGRRDRGE